MRFFGLIGLVPWLMVYSKKAGLSVKGAPPAEVVLDGSIYNCQRGRSETHNLLKKRGWLLVLGIELGTVSSSSSIRWLHEKSRVFCSQSRDGFYHL